MAVGAAGNTYLTTIYEGVHTAVLTHEHERWGPHRDRAGLAGAACRAAARSPPGDLRRGRRGRSRGGQCRGPAPSPGDAGAPASCPPGVHSPVIARPAWKIAPYEAAVKVVPVVTGLLPVDRIAGSVLSIGSVGSCFSVGLVGSFASAFSVGSSFRALAAVGDVGRIGDVVPVGPRGDVEPTPPAAAGRDRAGTPFDWSAVGRGADRVTSVELFFDLVYVSRSPSCRSTCGASDVTGALQTALLLAMGGWCGPTPPGSPTGSIRSGCRSGCC